MTRDATIAPPNPRLAARMRLSALKVGQSISASLIEIGGTTAEDECLLLTHRLGRLFEIDGGTITRVKDYGVTGKYNFTQMKPGESRVMDAPVTTWPAVRAGVRRSAQATGWRYRTSIRSGALVVTRVDGTVADVRQRLPFETTAIGSSFDVPSGPDVKVSNIRVQALYYGRKLGCRFVVEENGLGGCKVTRTNLDEAAAPSVVHQAPRVRPVPPAPPVIKPTVKAFDEDEF